MCITHFCDILSENFLTLRSSILTIKFVLICAYYFYWTFDNLECKQDKISFFWKSFKSLINFSKKIVYQSSELLLEWFAQKITISIMSTSSVTKKDNIVKCNLGGFEGVLRIFKKKKKKWSRMLERWWWKHCCCWETIFGLKLCVSWYIDQRYPISKECCCMS